MLGFGPGENVVNAVDQFRPLFLFTCGCASSPWHTEPGTRLPRCGRHPAQVTTLSLASLAVFTEILERYYLANTKSDRLLKGFAEVASGSR